MKIRQANNETVHEYLRKSKVLVEQTNLCLNPAEKLRERELFKYFVKGLITKNKTIVINQGLKNIEEIITRIQNVEDLEKQMLDLNIGFDNRGTKELKYCEKHGSGNHNIIDCFYKAKIENDVKSGTESFHKKKETKNIYGEEKHFLTIRLNIIVNDCKYKCLLDSGSNISLMSLKSFNLLSKKMAH